MLWIVQPYFFSLFWDWQSWKESWISSDVREYGPAHAHMEEDTLYFKFWSAMISLNQIHCETYLQLE